MLKTAQKKEIIIVGAGLGGSLMGIFLARRGFKITIIERRSDPRLTNKNGGRSINMTLSARGIQALKHVGLLSSILAHSVPLKGRMIHREDGALIFQRYSTFR